MIGFIKSIQRLVNRCIAILLDDMEKEFAFQDEIVDRAIALQTSLELDRKVDTESLDRLLYLIRYNSPSFLVIRKSILDNLNDLIRNIIQDLLGDVEGYGRRRDSKRDRYIK